MQKDILDIKSKNLKGKQKEEDFEENNIPQTPSPSYANFLLTLSKIITRKWVINIFIRVQNQFVLETTVLFCTGADLNCIKEGLIPTKYFEKNFSVSPFCIR